jgi:GT2 family glycosyltransferase
MKQSRAQKKKSQTLGDDTLCSFDVLGSDLPMSYLGFSEVEAEDGTLDEPVFGDSRSEELGGVQSNYAQLPKGIARSLYTKAREQGALLKQRHLVHNVARSGLFDLEHYLQRSPDVVELGINPIFHFVVWGGCEGRSPSDLFIADYFIAQGGKVRPGQNVLLEYLTRKENWEYSPHPLFDVGHYRAQYKKKYGKTLPTSRAPLSHFCRYGYLDAIDPHPYFDVAYYYKNHPDARKAQANPLTHYLLFGVKEQRKPHPDFDPLYYLHCYPDVKECGIEPLIHFVSSGIEEGRLGKHRPLVLEELIPSNRVQSLEAPGSERSVSVVIPVYRGLEETRRCIESVLGQEYELPVRVVIIDDCSPEPALSEWLSTLETDERVVLIRNVENKGFVASVNSGMQYCLEDDVILLNSDTLVPRRGARKNESPSWVERLRQQSYKDASIGTVCPQSNNATLCNFPSLKGFSQFLAHDDVDLLDAGCWESNPNLSSPVPTAVGFCMFIKRLCLKENGYFDEAAFGKGYGEEVDFCCRIERRGWSNQLAHDVFVYHRGEVSFGTSGEEKRKHAAAIVADRYPSYEADVARFFLADQASHYRLRAMLRVLQLREKPIELVIVHALGGGVESYVDAYFYEHSDVTFLQLKPVVGLPNYLQLSGIGGDYNFRLQFDGGTDAAAAVALFKGLSLRKVHIHHLLGFDPVVLHQIIAQMDVPYTFTVHDYFSICPQITLVTKQIRYCGEPDQAGCNLCIAARPSHGAHDIVSWRNSYGWVLEGAETVVVPSRDVERRMQRYFPDVEFSFVPHEKHLYKPEQDRVVIPGIADSSPLRVAVLGVVGLHKGRDLVIDAFRLLEEELPGQCEIKVIGTVQWEEDTDRKSTECKARLAPSETGAYKPEQLEALIADFDPHLIWFPARCPETYSYTLSSALLSGRPILASALGSFVERLADRQWVWHHSPFAEAPEIHDLLTRIRSQVSKGAWSGNVLPDNVVSKEVQSRGVCRDVFAKEKPKVLVLPEYQNGQVTPCAAIRLLPYFHDRIREHYDVRMTTIEQACKERCDILITHRIAAHSSEKVDCLLEVLSRNDTSILYDVDDNPLTFPKEHSEHELYPQKTGVVKTLTNAAMAVTASTTILCDGIQSNVSQGVYLFENSLDSSLWNISPYLARKENYNKCHIIYLGTATHADDFALVSPVLKRLKKLYDDRLTVTAIGVVEDQMQERWCRHVRPPVVAAGTYQGFVTWLQAINTFDIGIASLVESDFSSSTSVITWLNYSALGLATIASDTKPYSDAIRNGIDGLLAKNTARDWELKLVSLIESKDERTRLATAAKAELHARYLQEAQVDERISLLHKLQQGRPGASHPLRTATSGLALAHQQIPRPR